MKLSTKGRYGLRAILDLAVYQDAGAVSIQSIADRQNISESYLEQLLAKLKKAGLVVSTRGASGGYRLAKDAGQISVGDVLRALEGSLDAVACPGLDGDGGCDTMDICVTKYVWKRINDSINRAVDEIMLDKKFGAAGNRMVIEEFMTGREVSVLSFVDGKTIRIMTSAQDHKRAKDGDQGLNTGGMGTFSPSPFYTEEVDAFCKKYIYQATVDAMAAEGRPFKGVIFFGLMLTPNGPKVLEYNARFGDPEAQVVLPRMKNDIIEVMEACVDGTLDQIDLQFEDNAAVCVVLASDGYPVSYEKGFVISGLENFDGKDGYYCFHAGTKLTDKGIVTKGGRVLGVTAKGADLKEARANAYAATEWISFENKYMRHDIGKAIDEA